jgi:hypothetical protein
MYRQHDACYHNLFILTAELVPTGEVNGSRKLCSNPKHFGSRIVHPIAVQLTSTLGRLNICRAPTATIFRSHRDPLVFSRRDFDVWRVAREKRGLYNTHERVQKEGRERDGRDG